MPADIAASLITRGLAEAVLFQAEGLIMRFRTHGEAWAHAMRRIGRTADYAALKEAAKKLALTMPPAVRGDLVTSRSAQSASAVGGGPGPSKMPSFRSSRS